MTWGREMTDSGRNFETTDGGVNRRTILKGTAVAGLAGTALTGTASANEWKDLRFQAAGEEIFRYRVSVSGKLERAPNRDGGDTLLDENTAEGACSKGRHDDWRFTGDITELQLDGPGMVFVDGKLVRDTTAKTLPNRVVVKSVGKTVAYRFKVGGRVEKGSEAGVLGTDRITNGNTVSGRVGGTDAGPDPVDDYFFSGGISFAEVDGPLNVTLELNQH